MRDTADGCSQRTAKMQPVVVGVVKWASRYVTVEPLMFLFYVATTISTVVTQNLMIYKACWPDAQPEEMGQQCPDEQAAQAHVSGIATWKPFLQFLLPAVAVAFAGPWSDRRGRRRPLLLIPMVGQVLADVTLGASVLLWRQWTPTLVAIAETLPTAVAGGRGVLAVGVTSYLADVTSTEERTARMGVLMACVFVGTPVGSSLAGVSNRALGFLGSFALCAAVNLLALVYAAVRLREPRALQPAATDGLRGVLRLLARPRLLVLVASTFFIMGPMTGEYSVLYLFARYKFGWSEVDYSLYAAFKMILICGGSVLTVLLLCRVLKLEDSLIGLVSCLTQFVASLLYLVVSRSWEMYLVPIAELLHGASMAVQKSIGSKIVAPTDMGKLSALYSLSEAVVPLAIIPLYNLVYQHTFSSFPSAFFLTSAVLTAPALLMFIWMYVEYRKNYAKETQKDNTGEQPIAAVNQSFEPNESASPVNGADPGSCECKPRDIDVERGCSNDSEVPLDTTHRQGEIKEEDSQQTKRQDTTNCHKQPTHSNQMN
ncbi:solute carrier family 46 member 3-like [Schistocerca piceifrons]|uniref:solute carrier family 46 member 3-like n=1 Tax=Schistocerca piceifrons TaxID=274613 RepID=UPI001F5FF1C7|nr:solute carrier family 46 member 3-like [Schistocerca piceifrons]